MLLKIPNFDRTSVGYQLSLVLLLLYFDVENGVINQNDLVAAVGDKDQQGSVTAVVHFDSTSYRSAVSVAWDSGKTTTCRVGHMGHVDVQCNPEGRGPNLFFEHLPLLGNSYNVPFSSSPFVLVERRTDKRRKICRIDLLSFAILYINILF